jgi:hypothetical protein
MKKICTLVFIMMFTLGIPAVNASFPDVSTIVKKVAESLEKGRRGTQEVVFTIKEGEQITSQWNAKTAYKEFIDGKHTLLVMLGPEDLKGAAYLFKKPADGPYVIWSYFPPTRRTRKLTLQMVNEPFLGTDFTWTDFGIEFPKGTHKFLGEEMHAGKKAYKIETIPREPWYHSRIVSWIAKDTFLPIQHDYYDTSGRHWKTQSFENVVTFKDIPIPLKIIVKDVRRKQSTVVEISNICFDADYITREAFDPEKLSEASLSPVCAVPTPNRK